MNNNHTAPAEQFPELANPHATLFRVAEAFVAPEYASAAFHMMRALLLTDAEGQRLGAATVITSPNDFDNIVVTVASWWLMNFHIADAESLEEGDSVDEALADDYEEVLEETSAHHESNKDPVGFEDGEMVEATFYQVGTFLLDGTIIPPETIFDREDLDCYAYDYPEERLAGERFYWVRLIWEPEDLANEDLVNAVASALAYVHAEHPDATPFAQFHDPDLERLVRDEALAERIIAAADFGDVIVVDPSDGDN